MQYQIQNLLPKIESALAGFPVPHQPASLYEPIRYFLKLPGKRIRPIFVLQCLELFRPVTDQDVTAALATELFHNFSLVHDDIMDRADLRRGFETVHKKWNEPTALLAGDALMVLAYNALIMSNTNALQDLVQQFNRMALAVCEGQQLDMDFSAPETVPVAHYLDMIDRKTGALIAFCFEMGGFLGHVSESERQALHNFGLAMGRCFQLRDDYLDLFGNEAITGKMRGGDIANCKLSYPVLVSMASAGADRFLQIWNKKPAESGERVAAALEWMDQNNIASLVEEKITQEMENGMALLHFVKGDEKATTRLADLCKQLAYREK